MGLKDRRARSKATKLIENGDGRALLDALSEGDADFAELIDDAIHELRLRAVGATANAVSVAKDPKELRVALRLISLADYDAALAATISSLSHPSPPYRAAAARFIAFNFGRDQAAAIVPALDDADPEVRAAAEDTLREFVRTVPADELPEGLGARIAAIDERKAAERRAEREAEIAAPMTRRSAAKLLVELCNEIDRTYVEPIAADADARRARLRAQVVRIGERLDEDGGATLMSETAQLVASASAHGSYVAREWSGIGSWMG